MRGCINDYREGTPHTVNISDMAGVLNTSQVQSEAARYPVNIYTMNNFTGSDLAAQQRKVCETVTGYVYSK